MICVSGELSAETATYPATSTSGTIALGVIPSPLGERVRVRGVTLAEMLMSSCVGAPSPRPLPGGEREKNGKSGG